MRRVSCILPDALYLGDLVAAMSPDLLAGYKVTHVVSILQHHPSTGPHHLAIELDDSHFENLLMHLLRVCDFIDEAVAGGGVVLVHCQMGISRSASCVIAYVMRKNGLSLSQAVRFVRERRSFIMPNDGFMHQLQVFERCEYAPTEDHPVYIAWKKTHDEAVATSQFKFINLIPVVDNIIYLSSGIPRDQEDADVLLTEHEITHIVAADPSEVIPKNVGERPLHTISMANQKANTLVSLSDCVRFIQDAIKGGGRVLVHSLVVSTSTLIICAYLMSSRTMSITEAVDSVSDSVPLFNLTPYLRKHLESYEACNYQPTNNRVLIGTGKEQ